MLLPKSNSEKHVTGKGLQSEGKLEAGVERVGGSRGTARSAPMTLTSTTGDGPNTTTMPLRNGTSGRSGFSTPSPSPWRNRDGRPNGWRTSRITLSRAQGTASGASTSADDQGRTRYTNTSLLDSMKISTGSGNDLKVTAENDEPIDTVGELLEMGVASDPCDNDAHDTSGAISGSASNSDCSGEPRSKATVGPCNSEVSNTSDHEGSANHCTQACAHTVRVRAT